MASKPHHLAPPGPRPPLPPLLTHNHASSGEALSILHRRFCGQDKCRAAFMRVAGLAGDDLAPGMLEDIVIEMLALPAVRFLFHFSFYICCSAFPVIRSFARVLF